MFNKGNMSTMLKQAREIQKRIEEVQSDLEKITINAESGGGLITVMINGKQEILELNISQEAMEEDKELLEDLIISAINKALSDSQEEMQTRMNSVTGGMLGGLKIPGM
ncbi:MAG: YbaB/EbfC family nucleoid-associated protein [Candidatus Marinimicrobia bacterium]|nr:YbaB/EbfC family nucleoid-associated protein [Candidatus Neomarinimicrobiota bacterium]